MPLNPGLLKKLSQLYVANSSFTFNYRGKDVVVQTNDAGAAVRCFVGTLNEKGFIKGQRYNRVLKYNTSGAVIKDHWELKGPAS